MLRDGVRLFGTDGVRGVANTELTPEFALSLGRAAGSLIPGGSVLVGRDTRRSGEMLSMALQAGFNSAGVDSIDAGIVPTGGISSLTATSSADMGAVVSASHNPAGDNGIKFLTGSGAKMSDLEEDRIEAQLRDTSGRASPFGPNVGTRFPMSDAVDRYVAELAQTASYTFNGLSIALDCANGASYRAAPELFRRLKADVHPFADMPDGTNINEGVGATNPAFIAAKSGGMIGLAFDGDADRLIAVDEQGRTVNGDATLAIIARNWKRSDRLRHNTVVSTVMSNLGFRKSMAEAGIRLVQTQVGDRYVFEAMKAERANLGGEQSGHVIFLDTAKTGDGLLTAIRLLEVVAGTGRTLAELRDEALVEFPQVLVNVRVSRRQDLESAAAVWDAVQRAEMELGSDGRVLVRPSGTEPLVRVMVEAPGQDVARRYADVIAGVVGDELGKED